MLGRHGLHSCCDVYCRIHQCRLPWVSSHPRSFYTANLVRIYGIKMLGDCITCRGELKLFQFLLRTEVAVELITAPVQSRRSHCMELPYGISGSQPAGGVPPVTPLNFHDINQP